MNPGPSSEQRKVIPISVMDINVQIHYSSPPPPAMPSTGSLRINGVRSYYDHYYFLHSISSLHVECMHRIPNMCLDNRGRTEDQDRDIVTSPNEKRNARNRKNKARLSVWLCGSFGVVIRTS